LRQAAAEQEREQDEEQERREQNRRHLVELERRGFEQHAVDERVQGRRAAVEAKVPADALHVGPAVHPTECVRYPREVADQAERCKRGGDPRAPIVAATRDRNDCGHDDHRNENHCGGARRSGEKAERAGGQPAAA